jgi:hypothetical protein
LVGKLKVRLRRVDRRGDLDFCEGDDFFTSFFSVRFCSDAEFAKLLLILWNFHFLILWVFFFWLILCWISGICSCMLILMLPVLVFGVLIQLHVSSDVTRYGSWSVNSIACWF